MYGCSSGFIIFLAFLYFYSLVVHCDLSLGHTAAEHIHLSCFRVLHILTSTHCLVLNLQPWAQLCKCQYLCQFPIHKRRLSVNIRHYEALIKQAPIFGIWTVCLANRRGMTLKSYKLIKGKEGTGWAKNHSWDGLEDFLTFHVYLPLRACKHSSFPRRNGGRDGSKQPVKSKRYDLSLQDCRLE